LRKRGGAILLPLALVLSVALPAGALVVGEAMGVAAPAGVAAASTAGVSHTAAAVSTPAVPIGGGQGNLFAAAPNKGTITDYEFLPGGSVTEDPALAYDTASFEPILNVYQTLVNYNGSSTATYVPTLATCVPGTPQCAADYPGFSAPNTVDFITYNGVTGLPENFTFPIDPSARFFDPINHLGWPVYPTDVAFSIARTMMYADQPFVGRYNGWVLTQALLPFGNPGWDSALHFPWNNTPQNVMSSMLVNSSVYCPAVALNPATGNGCITFIATGSSADWPFFLQLVADDLGAGIEPASVFINAGAPVPGFSANSVENGGTGDGSVGLPGDSATNPASSDAGFQSWLATTPYTAWDHQELTGDTYPTGPSGNARWEMTGSGPYYATISVGTGYTLQNSPSYAQPAGCAGLTVDGVVYHAYPAGYCDPVADGACSTPSSAAYPCTVHVKWENSIQGDTPGYNAYVAGTTDFATIFTTDTNELVGLAHTSTIPCSPSNDGQSCVAPWNHQNKINIFTAPSLSNFAFFPNLLFNISAFENDFSSATPPQLPSYVDGNGYTQTQFFSGEAIRSLMVAAEPYTSDENNIFTDLGIVYQFNAGGPIPIGMGNYYPTNITWPYLANTGSGAGNPNDNPANVGSAAWWFEQGTTNPSPSNPYYDPLLASCLNTTCKFPVEGSLGLTEEDNVITAFISAVSAATEYAGSGCPSGGCLQPYIYDVNFATALGDLTTTDQAGSVYFLGWAPDYPDPTDYMSPYAYSNGAYTSADSVAAILDQASFNVSCPHTSGSYADLIYWANHPIPQHCQGAAYDESNDWNQYAAPLPEITPCPGGANPGPSCRLLDYNLVSHILNNLSLYVWQGQTNVVGSAAPWIAVSSVNVNPTIGGGGDQLFFQLKYAAPLTVHESGLPAASTWGVTVGGQNYNTSSTSMVIGAATGLNAWSTLTVPAGYALKETTPTAVGNGYVTIPATGTSITLIFAHYSTVTINDPGLPAGTHVTLTLIHPTNYIQPNQVQSGVEPVSFTFPGIVAGTWHYNITATPESALIGYKPAGAALPAVSTHTGAVLVVPNTGAPVTVTVTFALETLLVAFTEHGLTGTLTAGEWSVTVTGTESNGQPFSLTIANAGASQAALKTIDFHLPDGAYTYTLSAVGPHTAPGGSLTLGSVNAWTAPSTAGAHPAHTAGYPIVVSTETYT
jgi:hypothetical protein